MIRRGAALVLIAILLGACKDAAGPTPTNLIIVSGDGQHGLTGDTLPLPLVVKVTDAGGTGVAGVPVNWSTGSGTLLNTTTTSGADGTAQATMALGSTPAGGAVSVTAGSGDILVGFVVFAMQIQDRCDFPVPLILGSTVSGTLTEYDCGAIGDGSFLDTYGFTLAATQRVSFTMTSAAVDAFLFIRDGLRIRATNDNGVPGTSDAAISVLLKPGTYQVWANTFGAADFGAYQLTSATPATDVATCDNVWVTGGVTVAQTLPAAACNAPDLSTVIGDIFPIAVSGPDIIQATMTAAGFTARVRIWVNGAIQSTGTANGPGQPATAGFAVPSGSFGTIFLEYSSASGGDAGGAYTLSVTGGTSPLASPPAVARLYARTPARLSFSP